MGRLSIPLFLLLTLAPAWAQRGPGSLASDVDLERAGLTTYWQARLPLRPGDSLVRGYRLDAELFILTRLNDLFALKADEGLLRWTATITEPGFTVYQPTLNLARGGSTRVVVAATDGTTIFDRFSGAALARFKLPLPPGSPTLAAGEFLFTGSTNGRFSAFVLESNATAPFRLWEVATGGPITAAPLLYDENNLLFASQDGRVYACRAVDKALLWSYRTGGAILGDPAIDTSGVYIASTDRSLYKLDRGTGAVLWRQRLSKPLNDGPMVAGDTVYQFSPREGLIALTAADGAERWRREAARKLVASTKSGDFLWTSGSFPDPSEGKGRLWTEGKVGGRLELVDHQMGEVQETVATEAIDAVPNTVDGSVFLLGADGRVACLRTSDVPYLRRQQVQSARNQLNLPPVEPRDARDLGRPTEPPPARESLKDPFRSRREPSPK